MRESLEALDGLRLNFSQQGLLALNITLAIVMFGVALEIRLEHFKKLIYNPKSAILGFFSQFLILPALTYLLIILMDSWLTPSIALGMLLVASCPGGNISNFISSMAKGNVALSVSLTAMATLGAIFLTPLNFAFWGGLYASHSPLLRPLEIDPLQMLQTVFILLGIPLVLGIFVATKFPRFTAKIVKPIKNISLIIFAAFVIIALANNFDFFIGYVHLIILIVLIHNIVAFMGGYIPATIFRRPDADRRSLTIETGIQNSGLALVLIFNPNIFPTDLEIGGMAFIAAWWGIWHILAGMLVAWIWSRKKTSA